MSDHQRLIASIGRDASGSIDTDASALIGGNASASIGTIANTSHGAERCGDVVVKLARRSARALEFIDNLDGVTSPPIEAYEIAGCGDHQGGAHRSLNALAI
jgi:hypothetical protein